MAGLTAQSVSILVPGPAITNDVDNDVDDDDDNYDPGV